jgi:hypothetical protein
MSGVGPVKTRKAQREHMFSGPTDFLKPRHRRIKRLHRLVGSSSNCCSNHGDVPRTPATTLLAHSPYSIRRSTDQPMAGLIATARTLLILSASLINFASRLFFGAFSICKRLRSSFGSDLDGCADSRDQGRAGFPILPSVRIEY